MSKKIKASGGGAVDNSPKVHQRKKIDIELHIRELNWTPRQKEIIDASLNKDTRLTFIDGIWGSGKAQPMDCQVYTPYGPKRMGDMKAGDTVCTPDGGVANVIAVFPQGKKKIVKVTFSDGTSTECCEDHLWLTQMSAERNYRSKLKNSRKTYFNPKPPKIRTAKEIKETLYSNKVKGLNHSIQTTSPVFFVEQELPIDPYVFGALLGGGSFRGNKVSMTTIDQEIFNRIESSLPNGCHFGNQNGISYNVVDEDSTWRKPNRVSSVIKSMGLMNKYSYEKSVPDIYKYSSTQHRIDLLRGLMDTDGTVHGMFVSFSTTSSKLADDVRFLVESLGGTSNISCNPSFCHHKNGEKKQCRDSYNVSVKLDSSINPFFLKRKADKVIPPTKYPPKRYISSVEYIEDKDCQCILIDSDDHLYLTNNFIVTHNTALSVYICLKLLQQKKISNILYVRNAVQSGSGTLGWLSGDLESKFGPYVFPLLQKLEEFLPKSEAEALVKGGVIETMPACLIRGTSYNSYGIIVDEIGCMTKEDIMLVLSRAGEFTHVFGVGDSHQVDVKDSGFRPIFDIFNDEESKQNGVFTFELQEEMDIMRSKLLKFIMGKVRNADKQKELEGVWRPKR